MEIIPFKLSEYTLENYLIKITSGSKIIYWIILGITILGISILPLIYVDVSIQAQGYFQSDMERQILYAPFQGKVVFESIKDGKKVEKGDTILIIDSESLHAQLRSLSKIIEENNYSISDLEKLTKIETINNQYRKENLTTPKYYTEYANFKKLLNIQNQKYQRFKAAHERNEVLHKQNLIPDAEYEVSFFNYTTEKENLNQVLLHQQAIWQSDLTLRSGEVHKLQADYERIAEELRDRIVIAPLSGVIIQSPDIQIGSIVGLNQRIGEISPNGDLIAVCFVKPADMGLINSNQKVRIQVDAFNYNEWGMLDGDIIDISDDIIVEDGSEACFKIKCKPRQTYLSLKNGHMASIKKGMSLNARIVVIRRTLFNLLFDKADKWFNPYVNVKKKADHANQG